MAYVRKFVKKEPVVIHVNVKQADPHNLHARVMKQIAAILDALETEDNISWAQRLQAVNVMGRLIFADEKARAGEPTGDAGSAVRAYSQVFEKKAAGAGRRADPPRSTTGFDLDDDTDLTA